MPPHQPGKTTSNKNFDASMVEAVWQKAYLILGVDPTVTRKDTCGAPIARNQYGVIVPGGMGWEIDHVLPVSRGGSDALANLQPMQWQNNRAKSDSLLRQWDCQIASS